MATRGALGFKGLKTAGNPLTHPSGSLGLAQNCVIPSKDILEPRRGQPAHAYSFGTTSSTALALYEWGTLPVLHYGTSLAGSTLATFSGSAWVDNGTLIAPDPNVQRAKFAQMASNLYATSSSGLVVLDSTSHSTALAGVSKPFDMRFPPALNTALSGNPSASGTWFATDNAVAYRACFVKKDANNNVKLSAPNGRFVVINPSDEVVGASALTRVGSTVTAVVNTHNFKVDDTFTLSPGEANYPAGTYTVTSVTATTIVYSSAGSAAASTINETISSGTKNVSVTIRFDNTSVAGMLHIAAGDFIQIYRTDMSGGATVDPGDEMFLAYERQLSATDITNGYVTVTDTTPESFLGAALYSNANTGEGVTQSNEPPPICKDVAVFDGRLWGADTTGRQTLTLRLLGTGSPNGLQVGDILVVGYSGYVLTPTEVVTAYLPSQNINATTAALVYQWSLFDKQNESVGRRANAVFDGDSPTGQMVFQDVDAGGSTFYAACNRPSAFQDPLPTVVRSSAGSTVRASNVVTVNTTSAHGFTTGDSIVFGNDLVSGGEGSFPAGVKTVASAAGSTVFTYAETGSNATSATVHYVYKATVGSSSGARQLRYSKQGQPEAWPLVNYTGGLPDGATVLRIAPLNGSLYVFLKNGDIYTVSGSYPYNVQKFDGTATLIAADSLVEHSGRLHCLTTQGVVAISDTGVQALSTDIETDLRARIASLTAAQLARTFAVSYEGDRQYQLWMADSAAPTSFTCTGAWVYHSDSGLWTTWGGTNSTTRCNRTCGLVTKADNLLKLGDGDTGSTAKPQNYLRQELKNYSNLDCYDYSSGLTATIDEATHTVTPSSVGDIRYIQAGDFLAVDSDWAIVTANNGSTLTYSGTLTSSGGLDNVGFYMQVPAAFEWLIDPAGAAGVEKHWRDFQAHFSYVWAPTITATLLNERSVGATSPVSITPPDFAVGSPFIEALNMRTLRAAVPAALQRGAMLRLRLTFNGLNRFRALGWSQTQEGVGEKTPNGGGG